MAIPALPDQRATRARRVLPFGLLVLLALVLGAIPPHAPGGGVRLLAAIGCFAVAAGLLLVVPWERCRPGFELAPVVVFCVAVGFLRHGPGPSGSGYMALLFLPVLWQALYGRRVELVASWVLTSLAVTVPIVVFGSPLYPPAQWRGALVFAATTATTGWVIHTLDRSRVELVAQLAALVRADELTGLPNRRSWDELLAEAVAGDAVTSIAILDIDHFKAYNDRHGHLEGDALLRRVAADWRHDLRPSDHVARWGGEEFALLLPRTSAEEAVDVIHRLLAGSSGEVTWSAGVASNADGDARSMLAEADEMLYRAKAAGRDAIVSRAGLRSIVDDAPGGALAEATSQPRVADATAPVGRSAPGGRTLRGDDGSTDR